MGSTAEPAVEQDSLWGPVPAVSHAPPPAGRARFPLSLSKSVFKASRGNILSLPPHHGEDKLLWINWSDFIYAIVNILSFCLNSLVLIIREWSKFLSSLFSASETSPKTQIGSPIDSDYTFCIFCSNNLCMQLLSSAKLQFPCNYNHIITTTLIHLGKARVSILSRKVLPCFCRRGQCCCVIPVE